VKPILGSQPRFGLVLNLDLSQISKLRAFREYPRQKYSNPVPPHHSRVSERLPTSDRLFQRMASPR
jgi:hypothetical protein